MPLPTADDYAMEAIGNTANHAISLLQTMRYRGKGKEAATAVVRMREQLTDVLAELCDMAMRHADHCLAMTVVETLPPPPPKPHRRKLERIPKRRKK